MVPSGRLDQNGAVQASRTGGSAPAGAPTAPPRREWRPNGLLAIVLLVAAGIGAGAAFFRWRADEVRAGVIGELKAAPSDPDEQLGLWLSFGEPQIQNRLTFLRFSSEHPWLVTHTVDDGGAEPLIFGLDLRGTSPARIEREGRTVVVDLPAPRALARGTLRGDNAEKVPHYASTADAPDGHARAQELVEWFLRGLIDALPHEIEGAAIVVRIERPGPDAARLPGEAAARPAPGAQPGG